MINATTDTIGANKPRVTFAVIAFNQERYIDTAINAALAQEWDNLEVILSDDSSTDSTYERMVSALSSYRGSHTVKINRNMVNLGIGGHTNAIMKIATGALVIIAAGDDISYPLRTSEIVGEWLRLNRCLGYFYSGYHEMDISGSFVATHIEHVTHPPTTKDLWSRNIIGATEAWPRELFDLFGPLSESTTHEDRAMAVRASMLDGVHYVAKPLISWRQGGTSWVTPRTRLSSRERNARRYVCDVSQSLADFHTALSRGFIDNTAYVRLVGIVSDRLSFESLMLWIGSMTRLLPAALLGPPRATLRMMFSVFKAIRLRLPW